MVDSTPGEPIFLSMMLTINATLWSQQCFLWCLFFWDTEEVLEISAYSYWWTCLLLLQQPCKTSNFLIILLWSPSSEVNQVINVFAIWGVSYWEIQNPNPLDHMVWGHLYILSEINTWGLDWSCIKIWLKYILSVLEVFIDWTSYFWWMELLYCFDNVDNAVCEITWGYH